MEGVCNKNLVMWYTQVTPGEYSGKFDTKGEWGRQLCTCYSWCIHVFVEGFSEADLDSQYFYFTDSSRGFFFTDDCRNDKFEIRYVRDIIFRSEPVGILTLDHTHSTPSSIHQDDKSYAGYYLRLTVIIGSTLVLCAILCSVIYSQGESVSSLSALLFSSVLERYTYNAVSLPEDEISSEASHSSTSCADDDYEMEISFGGDEEGAGGSQRRSRRVARGKNVISHFDDDLMYL